jgi:hypothetical protein
MYHPHEGPRFEYREQQNQRVKDSPTFSEMFPDVKSLALDLGYYNSVGTTKNSQIKFIPNLQNARSVLRVDCLNNGCIRGDFDLTKELDDAVAEHRATVTGELCCQGWQSKTTIDTVPCHSILRYTLHLEYGHALPLGRKHPVSSL